MARSPGTVKMGLYARVSTHDQQTLALQRNAMARDYGWNHAVSRYVHLYAALTDQRPAKAPLRPRRVAVAALPAETAARKNAEPTAFVARRA